MKRRLGILLLFLGLISCGPKPAPLEVSFWYWHSPFALSDGQTKELKEMGVRRLFVRAGTFTHGYKVVALQKWAGDGKPFRIVLVFNFDSGLLSHFSQLNPRQVGPVMARGILYCSEAAKEAGVDIEGVQLDIDCPTRLLPKYADLIGDIKGSLGSRPWDYSVTALSSWLGTEGIQEVAERVDFLAPQFYEGDLPFKVERARPIGETSALANGMRKASSLPRPFFAGLAAYGHAFLYDRNGSLAGAYHGLNPEDALRHPALRFNASQPLAEKGFASGPADYEGEDLVTLTAHTNGRPGDGYVLNYYLPSPTLLEHQIGRVHENAPSNCLGVILYRFPEDGDTMALSLETDKAVLHRERALPELQINIRKKPDPWRLIEAGASSQATDLWIQATNVGAGPTACRPNAVQLLVYWRMGRLLQASPGDFDALHFGLFDPVSNQFEPCEEADANSMILSVNRMLPSSSTAGGEIEIEGLQGLTTRWAAIQPGSFNVVRGGDQG